MKKIIVSILLTILLSVPIASYCSDFTFPKFEDRYINDFSNLLDSNSEVKLENICNEITKSTNCEIVLVTIDTISPYSTIEDYSVKLFENWGIGNKGKDNGLLILLSKEERQLRIEVGYGLEGILNDGKCGEIIREVLPQLKTNNYNKAFIVILNNIKNLLNLEFASYPNNTSKVLLNTTKNKSNKSIIWTILIIVVLVLFYLEMFTNIDILNLILLIVNIFLSSKNINSGDSSINLGGGKSGGGGASNKF